MHSMEPEALASSLSWSDYSITEDEAYVYCRVGAARAKSEETFWRADSPQPTFEKWAESCRDSGFAERMLVNTDGDEPDVDEVATAVAMDESQNQFEDHEYYNLLPFQAKESDHDYTYPAFKDGKTEEDSRIAKLKARIAARRKARLRRDESRLSCISAKTVVNAARPYRVTPREPSSSIPTTTVAPIFKNTMNKQKAYCVECREEELEKLEDHSKPDVTYENLHCFIKESDTIELYGRLILTAMVEVHSAPGGMQRTAALQRKIEKILRIHTGIDLATPQEDFETAIKQFEAMVERRLRAINDISPSCYQKIADKLCLTQSAARRQKTFSVRLAAIRKSIHKLFGI